MGDTTTEVDAGWTEAKREVTIHGHLTAAPLVQKTYGSVVFRPENVLITYTVDGDRWTTRFIQVGGSRVKKDGSPSANWSEERYYLDNRWPHDCPDWLLQLADQIRGGGSDVQ